MSNFGFKIEKKGNGLARAGVISTPHGDILTPSFVTVGTKATVKALSPEQVRDLGAQVVLANTYHLYLEPGDDLIKKAGGVQNFMNWSGPTMTDSGGFQVFSLGAAFGKGVTKFASEKQNDQKEVVEDEDLQTKSILPLAKIDEEGVDFRSHIDGSAHRLTPESSIGIQHNIGADIIFAFDECTSPQAPYEYQKEALDRTHRWAKRSLDEHKKLGGPQALFGIVQGGKYEDLRKESAREIGRMDFDGFGIGGSFTKEDIGTAVRWVNEVLPENKPRHLLGIGEPRDLFLGVENGCDTFDCVAPTRMGRNAALYTEEGRINILNAQYAEDFTPIDTECGCYACKNYTKAYIAHLFRAKEMFAGTLASIHNLYFLNTLVSNMRKAILNDTFSEYKESFIKKYYK
ncbi:MAG: hypothetical protein RJA61_25 [Candidatus Parcubacteria bacterium]|jgi:queuine tRNA-ribosyltransferase